MAKGKAPAPAPKSSSGFESEIGVLQPVGFFDPLGTSPYPTLSLSLNLDLIFILRIIQGNR